jgi:mannose-6-phosphate isomerase-like protein (cupin superfamily)
MSEVRHLDTRTMEFVQDARFPEISVKLLESRTTHPTTSVVIARVAVGGGIPRHTHPVETETAYVLSGQGKLMTDTAEYTFDAGIIVTVPPGLAHWVVNTGDIPLEIFAIHSPPTR